MDKIFALLFSSEQFQTFFSLDSIHHPINGKFSFTFPIDSSRSPFPACFFSFRFYFSTFQVFLLYFIHPPNPSLPSRLNRSLLLPPTCRFTPPNAHSHTTKKHTCVVVCCSIRLIKSRLGGANSNLYYRGTLLLRIRLPSPARTFPQMRDGPRWNPAGIDSGHPNVTPFWPAVPFDHRPSLAFACSPRCVITSLYSFFFFACFGAANSS